MIVNDELGRMMHATVMTCLRFFPAFAWRDWWNPQKSCQDSWL